jgi:large subunit ribosomal protein L9
MKVILQDKVEHLGNTGDIVRVRDGFGRNFLLPRGLAVLADEGNVKNLEHQKRVVAARAAKMQKEAQELAAKISANPINIKMEAGEDNKLFGTVTNRDITDALERDGFTVDRKGVIIDEPIRQLGMRVIKIRLHPSVEASLTVYVTKA